MRYLIMAPWGWPCKLNECPPGHFVYNDQLCFKSEYGEDQAYNSAGEYMADPDLTVQPVVPRWVEGELDSG